MGQHEIIEAAKKAGFNVSEGEIIIGDYGNVNAITKELTKFAEIILSSQAQPAPSQSVDKTCEIDNVSSRVCEKGSKSCTVYHDKPQPASQDSDIVYITDDGYEVSRKEYAEFKQWITMKASPKG